MSITTTRIVKRDDEYVVLVYVDGKRYSPADYFTDDRTDAVGTARAIERQANVVDDDNSLGDDGPTCSLCDGIGHGYPGAGPCPLEERGANDEPDPYDN
jgi:hypothetical protein